MSKKSIEISGFQSFLGWFAEKNMDLLLLLGRLETKKLNERLKDIEIKNPIFICGLARSGSTILLELLAENSQTATYRYMDFPFAMIPFWWECYLKKYSTKQEDAVERSHKDGIFVTPHSPEAMEEILWMTFFTKSHNPEVCNVLHPVDAFEEFEVFYRATIRKLLLTRSASVYLAKNNYNILRLEYLSKLFPDCRLIVPIRDPVWHIASLIKQHQLLCAEEANDKRVLNYMRRTGHFEFGLDRRPMNVGSDSDANEVIRLWRTDKEIEGWAKYWRNTHRYLAEVLTNDREIASRTLVVDFNQLCQRPMNSLSRIYNFLGFHIDKQLLDEQSQRLKEPSYYAPSFSDTEIAIIKKEAYEPYNRMLKFAEN